MKSYKRKHFILTLNFFALLFFYLPLSFAQAMHLPIKIERYTSVMSNVNVRPYIKNIDDYRGLQLTAIQIEAGALVESATLDVFVNNSLQKKDLELGPVAEKFLITLDRDFIMGEGAEEINFLIAKPVYLKNIVLIFK